MSINRVFSFRRGILRIMDQSIRTHAPFLQLLQSTCPKQRQALLLTISDEQLQVLCEVVYNVYKGTLPLSRYYIDKLFRYKKDMESIIDRDVGRQTKVKLFVKDQVMLPWILKPLMTFMK